MCYLYFTDGTNNSGSDKKIHEANRESDFKEETKWTFFDSLSEAFAKNRTNFLIGFLSSVIIGFLVLTNDPADRSGIQRYMESETGKSYPQPDVPLGYKNAMRKRNESNPELYDA